MKRPPLAQISATYTWMWAALKISSPRVVQIRTLALRIIANKARYQKVATVVKWPWFYIACLHYRESNLNFHCHLHNGDPLNERTYHEPPGRPKTGMPPFTWEESAIDALSDRTNPAVTSIETFCYDAEDYNGWGYFGHGLSSSYLWAWSNQHEHGKFVEDHRYDPAAEDKQCGVVPLLNMLMSMDRSISFDQPKTPEPAPQVHLAWATLIKKWLTRALTAISFIAVFLT